MTAFAINEKVFFDHVRHSVFRGKMSSTQFKGLKNLLNIWRQHYASRQPMSFLAANLGTTYHETAHTMQPVKEYGGRSYFMRMYDVTGKRPNTARKYGNTTPGDGAKYPGRGYVQTTWKVNYKKVSKLVSDIVGRTVDFVNDPDSIMDPVYAAHALFAACDAGIYTGKSWKSYIKEKPTLTQFVKSRRVVNGTDKANLIAGYCMAFWEALEAARDAYRAPSTGDSSATRPDPSPVDDDPVSDLPPPPVSIPHRPDRPTTGTPPHKSKSVWAVVITFITAMMDQFKELIGLVEEGQNTLAPISGMLPFEINWGIIVMVVMTIGLLWLGYDRIIKSRDHGV